MNDDKEETSTVTTDTDTFPTTTFDSVEFTGAGAMKSNFKGNLIFEVANLPQALVQMQGLHTTKGKLVFVSDQGQLPDAGDEARDWASTELQLTEESEVEYGRTCVGGACPHFCVPKEGDLAGEYVCYHDPDALMVCVHGVTLCPLGAPDETEEADCIHGYKPPCPDCGTEGSCVSDAGEAVGETDADDSGTIPAEGETPMAARGGAVVVAVYPGDDPVATPVGPTTQYAELIADYLASVDAQALVGEFRDPESWRVVAESELVDPEKEYGRREPHDVIWDGDYGKRLRIVAADQGGATGEESAA